MSSRNALSSLMTSSTYFRNSDSFSFERPDRISSQPALDFLFRIKSFPYTREHLGIVRHCGVFTVRLQEGDGSRICGPPYPTGKGMTSDKLDQEDGCLVVNISLLHSRL